MERWVLTCRRELLDRTLIWNQAHLVHALAEFEAHYKLAEFETQYNEHRPRRALDSATPLSPATDPIIDTIQLDHLDIHRRDRPGGLLHEYADAA